MSGSSAAATLLAALIGAGAALTGVLITQRSQRKNAEATARSAEADRRSRERIAHADRVWAFRSDVYGALNLFANDVRRYLQIAGPTGTERYREMPELPPEARRLLDMYASVEVLNQVAEVRRRLDQWEKWHVRKWDSSRVRDDDTRMVERCVDDMMNAIHGEGRPH